MTKLIHIKKPGTHRNNLSNGYPVKLKFNLKGLYASPGLRI